MNKKNSLCDFFLVLLCDIVKVPYRQAEVAILRRCFDFSVRPKNFCLSHYSFFDKFTKSCSDFILFTRTFLKGRYYKAEINKNEYEPMNTVCNDMVSERNEIENVRNKTPILSKLRNENVADITAKRNMQEIERNDNLQSIQTNI